MRDREPQPGCLVALSALVATGALAVVWWTAAAVAALLS